MAQVTFSIDLRRFQLGKLDSDTVLPRPLGTSGIAEESCHSFSAGCSASDGVFPHCGRACYKQIDLWSRRVCDVAACNPGLKCYLNGKIVQMKDIKTLANKSVIALSKNGDAAPAVLVRGTHERWRVAIAANPGRGDSGLSYVNSVATTRGGTHVKAVMDHVVDIAIAEARKKEKDPSVTLSQASKAVFLVVAAQIENPVFDSQAKEMLVTPPAEFGSSPGISDSEVRRVLRVTGIVDKILSFSRKAQGKALDAVSRKMTGDTAGGANKLRLSIPKLEDANWAGGPKSAQCTLILTEGDSAKALAVSGLSILGRNEYGVFPLKGKLLNVRDASHKTVRDNAEFTAIKAILGLQHGKQYEKAREGLRYGKVMLMTDQDVDGSHIKGLFFNMMHHFWPNLLQKNDFIVEFVTPIVKAFPRSSASGGRGEDEVAFFTLQEYNTWWAAMPEEKRRRWRIKYYKGLGATLIQNLTLRSLSSPT